MKTDREKNKGTDLIINKNTVGDRIAKCQRAIADFLNSKVNKFSQPVKKRAFLFLGMMIGLVCLGLIFQSVNDEKVNDHDTIDQITLPHDIQSKSYTKDSTQSIKN